MQVMNLNVYKKYLFVFFSLILVNIVIIYPAIFYLQLGAPAERSRYIYEWLDSKKQYATSINTGKLLVISGSSTLFGISAETIERECNIPTVNMGSHAGLGLKYILYDAKKVINEGDIVLLPLEYEEYKEVEQYGEEYLNYISDRDPEYFIHKNVFEKIDFILSMNPIDIYYGAKAKIRPDSKIISAYDSTYLNQNGDMTNNSIEKKLNGNILLRKMPKFAFENKEYPSKESKQCLEDFLEFCKEKNVKVFVTYPAYLYHAKSFEGQDLKAINEINEFWKQQNNVIILGNYKDFLYDVNDFYDTIYHLNNIGKEKRTKQLIKYLKPFI